MSEYTKEQRERDESKAKRLREDVAFFSHRACLFSRLLDAARAECAAKDAEIARLNNGISNTRTLAESIIRRLLNRYCDETPQWVVDAVAAMKG